jgi:trafficking protein particle complex subunit 6
MATLPTLTTTPVPAPVGSSDPLNQFLSTTCMDLLLIELVPLSKSLARNPLPQQDSDFLDTNPPTSIDLDDDSEREAIYFRLEPLGFRVGQGIAERYSSLKCGPKG